MTRLPDPLPSPPAEGEYEVGPGRPPKQYQFKPGQSGNPKGAKRKTPSLIHDLRKVLESALNQKVTVTQGERERIMSVWAAGMRQLSIRLAKGTGTRFAMLSGSPKNSDLIS